MLSAMKMRLSESELAAGVVGAIAVAERRKDFRTSGRDTAKRLA